MQKLERMMAIILALNKKEKLTAEELAGIFEVNIRTIYRDIQALSEMEVPITTHIGSNGGYSLMNKYFIPPVMFTREEILALLLSEKIISIVDLPGYSQHINTAFLKIKSLVSNELHTELEKIEKRTIFDISFEYPDNQDPDIFKLLESSIIQSLKLNIEYINTYPSYTRSIKIRPYGLIFDHGAWDIIGFDETMKEEQIFKTERIKGAKLLNEKFTIPGDFDVSNYYNCKNYADALNKGDRHIVRLMMSKHLYYEIKDRVYFKDAAVNETEDAILLSIATRKPEDYIWLSLQYDGEIKIIEPAWLIDELCNRLKKLNKTYNF